MAAWSGSRLNRSKKLLALGDDVVISLYDFEVHAEALRRMFRRPRLFDLVVVIRVREG